MTFTDAIAKAEFFFDHTPIGPNRCASEICATAIPHGDRLYGLLDTVN